MPVIIIETKINADIKICFDLSRNIDFHKESLKHSNEKAIAGKTSGLIELGEWVTWEAVHFGIKQKLTSKITELKSPSFFVDEMVSGAFKSFRHEHHFKKSRDKTIMIDKFFYKSPFGILGQFVDWLFLKKYVYNLLKTRNMFLKEKAEAIF
ncbi:SRPBCC family protein [Flavivirga aquimarina]|uniref:SRPBCC family protein n=1 Tax=Flavivirga aquimarina TaxID=2027862 RepID=A0ABT8W6U6_9FLAO|nr:SRPBCC family protein [Flavivirga aquimarina]MDO5968797.1 SRPBCC family protein [Flavivirga aquimarina]